MITEKQLIPTEFGSGEAFTIFNNSDYVFWNGVNTKKWRCANRKHGFGLRQDSTWKEGNIFGEDTMFDSLQSALDAYNKSLEK